MITVLMALVGLRVLIVDKNDLFRAALASLLAAQEDLSYQELELLQLLARRLDIDEIAAELSISPRMARSHVSSILNKIMKALPAFVRPGEIEAKGSWSPTRVAAARRFAICASLPIAQIEVVRDPVGGAHAESAPAAGVAIAEVEQ